MASDQTCPAIKTIDNTAVFKAVEGLPLETHDVTDCSHTLLRQVYNNVGPKTVFVESETNKGTMAYGSGFFTGKDGDEIVTNAHVVNGTKRTFVETPSGEVFTARIIDMDDINDLARLKVDGLKKDPSRSVTFADAEALKPGDPLLAVGHPAGIKDLVTSDGESTEHGTVPLALLYSKPDQQKLIDHTAYFQVDHPEYSKDVEKWIEAPKVSMDTPIWHGNSGSPVVNEHNQVVGVAEQLDPSRAFLSYAVPASKVTEMLNAKERKFDFAYKNLSKFNEEPVETAVVSAATLGFGYALRKYAAPVFGAIDAVNGYDNIRSATRSDLYRSKSTFIEAAAEDAVGVAGGIMSLIPRTRAIGYGLFGLKLVADEVRNYIPNRPVLKSITRTDKSDSRPPFLWENLGF